MPVFALPLALLGLAALPTLAGIYWLRNRFKRQQVSSLMLWVDQRSPREGGVRMQRLQTPLLFFLELLALACLALAAASPTMLLSGAGTPLLIVLDDSYSMLAEADGETARQRGLDAIAEQLDQRGLRAQFVLAGGQPQVLGEMFDDPTDAEPLLERWTCQSSHAALQEAITLATEIGGPQVRVLVITDHAPAEDLAEGPTRWVAVGRPAPNLAVINAVRTAGEPQDRILLEVANLSAAPAGTVLHLTSPNADAPLRSQMINLGPGQSQRVVLAVPAELPALQATIDGDALAVDDQAVLAPPNRRPVRVGISIQSEPLQQRIVEALRSAGRFTLVTRDSELLFTDQPDQIVGGQMTWPVYLIQAEQPQPFVGPFVVNRNHPLGVGIALGGVVWSASEGELEGQPVITAGNTDLLTDLPRLDGRHELRMQFNPDTSTFQRTANWPILMWNLIQWRASEAPGLQEANIRLGRRATLIVEPGVQEVRVTPPDGETVTRPVFEQRMTIQPDAAGLWTFQTIPSTPQGDATTAPPQTYLLGVNALQRDESSLADAAEGSWGNWLEDTTIRRQYTDVAWVLLLVALSILALHGFLISRSTQVTAAELDEAVDQRERGDGARGGGR